MRIYLDDDLDSNALIGLLRSAGHEAASPRAAGNRGIDDEDHLRFAAANSLTLMTANAKDFIDLHEEWTKRQLRHSGILILYRENNPTRDMTSRQIAQAVTKIEQSGIPMENACYNLNFWR